MNKVILLLGDLATGKSTYSRMLGERYNCLVLNKDTIKETLGDVIGFKNRQENKRLSVATFKIMMHVFAKQAKTHQDIILEANFHREELDVLYCQCEELGYDVLTVIFQADVDILYKRFMNRVKNENRHPVHVTEDLIEYESFKRYVENSRDFVPCGKIIRLNCNDFSYQDSQNFAKIDKFIKSSL